MGPSLSHTLSGLLRNIGPSLPGTCEIHIPSGDIFWTLIWKGCVRIQNSKFWVWNFQHWYGHFGTFCDRGIKMTVWEQGFWKQPLENMSPEGDLTRQCADSRCFPGSWRPGKVPKIITTTATDIQTLIAECIINQILLTSCKESVLNRTGIFWETLERK